LRTPASGPFLRYKCGSEIHHPGRTVPDPGVLPDAFCPVLPAQNIQSTWPKGGRSFLLRNYRFFLPVAGGGARWKEKRHIHSFPVAYRLQPASKRMLTETYNYNQVGKTWMGFSGNSTSPKISVCTIRNFSGINKIIFSVSEGG